MNRHASPIAALLLLASVAFTGVACSDAPGDGPELFVVVDVGSDEPDAGTDVGASSAKDATQPGRSDFGETVADMSGTGSQDDTGQADSGSPFDSGGPDVGALDAGYSDAGSADLGVDAAGTIDGGTVDAGTTDTGATDTGAADVGPMPTVHRIYMSRSGSDSNPGTMASPIRTLQRANALLLARQPDLDVEIHIEPAVYTNQYVLWEYYHPNHTTTFMPWGWDRMSTPQRPVFDGDRPNTPNPWNFFFKLARPTATTSATTNLEFYWIHVRDYRESGISFIGNPDDPAGWIASNRVEECVFERIGNKWLTNAAPGYDAIKITNGREHHVLRNEFLNLENSGDDDGLMHGVYLAHGSVNNIVNFNLFDTISGDPLRVRDGSNSNTFHSNTIRNSGKQGYYGDWWCNPAVRACPRTECPSFDNSLRYNDFGCTGYNGAVIPPFYFHHGRACVPSGCPDRFATGSVRLSTAGNSLPDVDGNGQPDCSLGPTQPSGSGTCP